MKKESSDALRRIISTLEKQTTNKPTQVTENHIDVAGHATSSKFQPDRLNRSLRSLNIAGNEETESNYQLRQHPGQNFIFDYNLLDNNSVYDFIHLVEKEKNTARRRRPK